MFINITSEGPVGRILTLEEPDDCSRFHVEGHGVTQEGTAAALIDAGLGTLDEDRAWIQPDALRRLAEGRVAEDWSERFEGMLAYASSKGWVDEQGRIQAHCEWHDD